MSTNAQFEAFLPTPYKGNWKEAYRADSGESPRMASYQAPDGEEIPFIQKSFRFSGGQSTDTAEYPFGGLWSNEYLNEKPQSLTVDGYLRGPYYIVLRNKLIEALRIPTDDDNPGYIDLPFWGRFPVVVKDNYEISETSDEQGQCAVSITFTRAGVSITDRLDALPPDSVQVENASKKLKMAAIIAFLAKLSGGLLNITALTRVFGKMKNILLSILGRVQGSQAILNGMTNDVLGIMNLINQGIHTPREFAQALFNAADSISSGIQDIKNSIAQYDHENDSASTAPSLPAADNEKNVLLFFLSTDKYTLSEESATVSEETTIKASEDLYRIMAFLVSARLIANMDSLTYKKATGYWRLLEKLEMSIDRDDPAVYVALQDIHTALSRELLGRELSREMTRHISAAVPLLYLAHYLGCDESKIRELNSIADSFVVKGDVIYG